MNASVVINVSLTNEKQWNSTTRKAFSAGMSSVHLEIGPNQQMETCFLDQGHLLYFPRREKLIIQQ
jgi:hypothetical protein